MPRPLDLGSRAARHAALGEPARLAIADELSLSDRAPVELRRLLQIDSNLLAHHLDVLERVGLIERSRSAGDQRRRYVRLVRPALEGLAPGRHLPAGPALFVCRANSARSPLAAALWTADTGQRGTSAGTCPADRLHPGTRAAARRHSLVLPGSGPRALPDPDEMPPLVVTVCDEAHESLGSHPSWLHWSIPDPAVAGSPAAFDATVAALRERILGIVGADRDAA